MKMFDPRANNFTRLQDFQLAPGVESYEYNKHPVVDGKPDIMRLNVYLSKDGDYVVIWYGLLEPVLAEARFELPESLDDFNFYEQYYETLFRGYIKESEEATVILNALCLDDGRYGVSRVLASAPYDLRCENI